MEPGGRTGPDELAAGAQDRPPAPPWRRWALGVAAFAVGLAVLRPDNPFHFDPVGPAAAPSVTPTPAQPASLAGVNWAARGDLVDDAAFVARALDRVRQERPDVGRLYFAGRLPDGSRLVLAGTDVNRGMVATSVHALYVPPGAAPTEGELSEATALVDPQQFLAWAARGSDGHVHAVVLTRPGPVRFRLSPRVEFRKSDGAARRTWAAHPSDSGVVVADLGRRVDPIIGVTAEGPGVFGLPLAVRVLPREPTPSTVFVAGVGSQGYQGPGPTQITRALQAQAGAVADLAGSALEVLWSGAPWRQRRLALILVTRPDGQRFQALVGEAEGGGFAAGLRALPTSAPNRVPWLMEPFSPGDPTLLLCPTGDGSVIYRGRGGVARTFQIGADGVVALAEPAPSPPQAHGAEVTVLDADGHILLRTRLPEAGFDDPLALD